MYGWDTPFCNYFQVNRLKSYGLVSNPSVLRLNYHSHFVTTFSYISRGAISCGCCFDFVRVVTSL